MEKGGGRAAPVKARVRHEGFVSGREQRRSELRNIGCGMVVIYVDDDCRRRVERKTLGFTTRRDRDQVDSLRYLPESLPIS